MHEAPVEQPRAVETDMSDEDKDDDEQLQRGGQGGFEAVHQIPPVGNEPTDSINRDCPRQGPCRC